ncbi:hypothetical protein ARC23_00875 [Stenotrophomonas beteli]|uniref:Uncharacterized protein n=1 Tax=Stenotrophomonas beteli TaxID=3384461 RepID=A0A0R0B130_9GAMM|nr:hypothetical protein ARC23_00875 [Stenotrophomonas maltophilia]
MEQRERPLRLVGAFVIGTLDECCRAVPTARLKLVASLFEVAGERLAHFPVHVTQIVEQMLRTIGIGARCFAIRIFLVQRLCLWRFSYCFSDFVGCGIRIDFGVRVACEDCSRQRKGDE